MGTQQEKLAIIARVHQEWALEQSEKALPPRESGDRKWVEAEGEEIMNASAEALDDLVRRTNDALKQAGFQTP